MNLSETTRSLGGVVLGDGGSLCCLEAVRREASCGDGAPKAPLEALTPFMVTAVCTLEATASTRDAIRSQLSPSFFLRMAFSA